MFRNNRELRIGTWLLAAVTLVLTGGGFAVSFHCGMGVLTACAVISGIHLATEAYRYRRLGRMSRDLDRLLYSGEPLLIREYEEGELSILANQIQKITRSLLESGEAVKTEKLRLADALADISHQLRTPLTAMNLTASMLRSTKLSQTQRAALIGELSGLLRRTDELVETLLKLSKLDAGTVTLSRDCVAVEDLIRRAAEPLGIPMELRRQTLVVDCGDVRFTGDLLWSGEALGNILKNCVEHTPEGGTITVTARQTPLYTWIQVEDTGGGFDPKDIPHLFERFYKGCNGSERSCGIGLSLARTVIAAQNGTLQAMNGSTGARFVVKFYRQVI